ncbi:MAG: oligosaccharide flippase family protein, partial [Cyclobacteriaceae bacterium]|nr:oligosaccharide flippase family protein [Cyclobacteriaceae bacterium]
LTQFVLGCFFFKIFPINNLKRNHLKDILAYSFPLMLYALGGIGYSHGYRIIISNWLSLKDLAVFSFTVQIAQIYYLTASSSVTGFYPKAYKALEENQGQVKSVAFYFKILLSLGLLLGACIFPLSYLLLKYFKNGTYISGIQILPILFMGQFVFLLYGYNYILCTFYKETKILTYSMLAGVTVSLILAKILLNESKLWGAAIPMLSGLTVQFVLSWYLIRRVVFRRMLLN